jgi:integrase
MLQQLDVELAEDKLAPSSRRNAQIVARSVLRVAVDAGLLSQLPRLPKLPKVGRKTPNPIHREDVDAFLATASTSARVAFALAAFAGLRRSEVIGLRWSDVDLKGNVITVRRAVTRGEETTPKSGKPRPIPIATPLRNLLEGLAAAKKSPWAPVAVTAAGKMWGEYGLNQTFQRAQKRTARSGACFHDLRHFFITELFRKGVSAPVVQRLAGHADLSTTQRYADMVASDLSAGIALL